MKKILLDSQDINMLSEAIEAYIELLKGGHCDLAVKDFKRLLDEINEQGK